MPITEKQGLKSPPLLPITGRGRPGINWPVLFDIWITSGKSKKKFLAEYGINSNSGFVKRGTSDWVKRAKNKEIDDGMPKYLHEPGNAEIRNIYKQIMDWRIGQAESDYKTADAIKAHIKLLINTSIERTNQGAKSTLSSGQLKALAQALESVQRIQRLAIGLSTENFGIDIPSKDGVDDSNVEKPKEDMPTFVVEVNEGGKFKSARPRKIA